MTKNTEMYVSKTMKCSMIWLKSPARVQALAVRKQRRRLSTSVGQMPSGQHRWCRGRQNWGCAWCLVLGGISPSSFGATSWYFPAMYVWVEVIMHFVLEGAIRNYDAYRVVFMFSAIGSLRLKCFFSKIVLSRFATLISWTLHRKLCIGVK